MIANNLVKAAIVARLKALSSLVALLPDGLQGIRESGWRGDDFAYPNVRVELETQTDFSSDSNCSSADQPWSVYVFSQSHSSQEADTIAGLIVNYFKGSSFGGSGVKFSRVEILENIPAIPEDGRTWRAQIRCRSTIYAV